MSELFTVTVDDRQVEVPKGTGLVEAAQAAGIEIPVFCYEPRLGPPVGACRMCLVEIEGMPKLQAGCTLTVTDGMVIKTSATSAKAAEGQEATLEFILVNHPLDCPVCDKGGECPLQDLTFRHGPRQHAHVVREAHRRQADPGLAAHRARPRALHPLLPLHAVLGGRCRGRPAHRAESRRPHRDRDVRGRAVPLALLRQRRRALPGRRAHVDALPLRRAAVGHPERPHGLHGLRGRLQHVRDDPRGQGQAGPLAQPSGGRPRLALRQGSLLLPAPAGRGPHHGAAAARKEGARGGLLGRGARRCGDDAARVRRLDRHGVLGLGDDRDRVRARAPAARWARCALGRPPRGHVGRARGLPPAAQRDRRGGDRRRGRRRAGRGARADRRSLDQGGPQAWRRDRRLLADGHREDRSRLRRDDLPRAGGRPECPREEAGRGRTRGSHLVGRGRRRRSAYRGARTRALARSEARQRRVPSSGRIEPAGRGARLGSLRGRGRDEPGADRAPDRVGRRGCGERRRARARGERETRARPHDVPRARRRLGRPDPPVDRLARARRHLDESGRPRAAPAARRQPALPRRARLDLEARGSLRRRRPAARDGRLRRAVRAPLPRPDP